MKKAKKIVADIIILLLFGGFVFFVGWIQFYVKTGTCAVMSSKTSGVYPSPVVSGRFLWRWERLLPTNVSLAHFSLDSKRFDFNKAGTLPDGEYYSTLVNGKIDFTYSVSMTVQISVTPENILSLYKENLIKDQESLDLYVSDKAKKLSDLILNKLLVTEDSFYLTDDELAEKVISENPEFFKYIDLSSFVINNRSVPDVDLYLKTKKLYDDYKIVLDREIKNLASQQAAKIMEENRNLERLEKFGELITKYPDLAEPLKSGEITQILNLLK